MQPGCKVERGGQKECHTFGRYRAGEVLGVGSQAVVRIGQHVDTGEKVALKIIKKHDLEENSAFKTALLREIAVLRLLNHPNVIKLHDVVETEEVIVLVLEHMDGGELYDLVENEGRLGEDTAREYFKQLLAGLRHCHERSICHRDLKLENLLCSKSGRLVIADFGLSSSFRPSNLLSECLGSPHYIAPEVYRDEGYCGPKADIWSCGVILYALITAGLPFAEDDLDLLMKKVQRGRFYVPSYVSDDCADLIRTMINLSPQARPTVEQVCRDSWLGNSVPKEPSGLGLLHKAVESGPVTAPQSTVVEWLSHLGWGSISEVKEALSDDADNTVKNLYHILHSQGRLVDETTSSEVSADDCERVFSDDSSVGDDSTSATRSALEDDSSVIDPNSPVFGDRGEPLWSGEDLKKKHSSNEPAPVDSFTALI
mmetsp:Transcript_5606/g.16698  ORF Transcript_5606/g.16698 Transcript_5606/m.16698 type:complete len:427 (-) Transcript_5606:115-1395(-)|eukprot:CAMPEP_0198735968 /NCGR_PEP_ID=MMETSP1475-20131203/62817_1 /TAXON_ID= ORGANISM="Unidentified sp., Strain CCMP1999" /NCGR_SAMPLE_ID=MMETSP1475 /ASSEMBLY_ACC=CAM_ASM_001111 /LENGTH=426 /DNA_ID=CAMNT_0044499709 /DNA_START=229 /DNA_END=1509 /DNA_ORIENTATION=-